MDSLNDRVKVDEPAAPSSLQEVLGRWRSLVDLVIDRARAIGGPGWVEKELFLLNLSRQENAQRYVFSDFYFNFWPESFG